MHCFTFFTSILSLLVKIGMCMLLIEEIADRYLIVCSSYERSVHFEEWQQVDCLLLRYFCGCSCVNVPQLTNVSHSQIFYFSYSGANIYTEDQTLCTPVLTAAAHKKINAFHCLMSFVDLKDEQKNPLFKVLHVKVHQVETLKVSLHSLQISMSWWLMSFGLSFNSFLLLTPSGDQNSSNLLTARRIECYMSLQGKITYQPWQFW